MPWSDVRVGDIVELSDGDGVCADGVLLSSTTDQGLVYVETSALDGEVHPAATDPAGGLTMTPCAQTNLKIRQSCRATSSMRSTVALSKLRGRLHCELPNPNMYRFRGSLQIADSEEGDDAPLPITLQNVLLRGSFVRNTARAYLLVAYTGRDTKHARNMRATPSKRSNIDRLINSTISLVFVTLAILCSVSTILFAVWVARNTADAQTVWYLPFVGQAAQLNSLTSFITFLILFNNLVPISLYVTLELVKLVQARLISDDIRMFHSATRTPALARTSNLNEDLGQIEHIFCDKTGTLTCNEMLFRLCTTGGVIYEAAAEPAASSGTPARPGDLLTAKVAAGPGVEREFVRVMAVCHTVLPEILKVRGRLVTRWQASSPDEEALVNAAIGYGHRLVRRDHDALTVSGPAGEEMFAVLNVNEFTSQRKCMSVIVRTPDGRLVLYCKGADDAVFAKLGAGQDQEARAVREHLQQFAVVGLRTLVMAMAVLDEDVYAAWAARYQAAQNSIADDKDDALEALSNEIEVGLSLLGATGIEDRLQDGVPGAIRTLLSANIKVWVLTGDKIETAINIGKSSSLISSRMQVLRFGLTDEADIDIALLECQRTAADATMRSTPLAMVVDGRTLSFIVEHKRRARIFLHICNQCQAVIACRASPKQKAGIVAMVKRLVRPEPMTLAIGDGANDIGMLQEAHVGVGISGNEGMQAVNSADYAIAQFRFLTRLVLVHGNWNYRRVSVVRRRRDRDRI